MTFAYASRASLSTKLSSLAAEARIIKAKEQRWLLKARNARNKQKIAVSEGSLWTYHHIRRHRLSVVRPEARAANIAFGFLNGRKYAEIEAKVHLHTYATTYTATMAENYQKFWEKVLGIVNRFSHGTYILAEIEGWRDRA